MSWEKGSCAQPMQRVFGRLGDGRASGGGQGAFPVSRGGGVGVCWGSLPAGCPTPHGPALPLQDLGAAAGSKRPTCVILIKPHEEYQEAYDECLEDVEALPMPL